MKCSRYRSYLTRKAKKEELAVGLESLRSTLPAEYREHFDSCRGCRRFTAALHYLDEPGALSTSAPSDLASRAARTARNRRAAEQKEEQAAVRRRALPAFPRWAQLAAAAVALIIITAAVTLQFAGSGRGNTTVVHLHLKAPDAEKVAVVGDWNDWQPGANPLEDEDGDGVWETKIRVPEGSEYQYQFLINGEKWVPDPNAPLQVEDGFGGTNSVLDI